MRIGIDAKRAFFNSRGLGNYSRDTIRILTQKESENQYFLYSPKKELKIDFAYNRDNSEICTPEGWHSNFSALWRTRFVCDDIRRDRLDIYHGLSHELPYGIEKTGVRSVVTMHDLIFLKNPELFPFFDRYTFKKKYTHGCRIADRVIAISEETKSDLINYLGEKEERIDVVYQGCNPIFHQPVTEAVLQDARTRYALPEQYMLIVCAIEKRKNHQLILKAMRNPRVDLPLVVVGRSSEYQKELFDMIREYRLEKRVLFLNEVETAQLPALYKLSSLFVYPSFYEGFGIPILEALTMGVPVVTSKGSCFKETGGEAACYIDPYDEEELSENIIKILSDDDYRGGMIKEGLLHAGKFTDEIIAKNLFSTYKKIL
jgi:glycosyltransferase involved in cell wall biosynthesis